ncbi:hypothetical protein M3X98_15555 (plasmid) [Enterococcus faecium]|uniref:Uncharacterized protein n=1 Tax=Enterococcus faecium TaxID=1352 RepID=A0A9X3XZ32_ENTFC|nr:hypothetical protein [Enterococcus faecium]MDC4249343.1 hypothetical protein [Enterococcus faecium]
MLVATYDYWLNNRNKK